MRILFVSSEVYPLMKTGGLADVSASLPRALQALGHDVRVLMPAYRDSLRTAHPLGVKLTATADVVGHSVRLLETRLPDSRNRVWLLDCPGLFDRAGNPYYDAAGNDYHDNPERFMLLCRVAALLAMGRLGLEWQPDIVHCNDWQSGLTPLLLREEANRPAVIFTIHNLAYQGVYPHYVFDRLGLPSRYWHADALEFHGNFSFIKGGLVYSDRITTVSPTYAREIQTAEFGWGLEGLLRHRSQVLSGILNGIDTRAWNPAQDPALAVNYSAASLDRKRPNKIAMQAEAGLDAEPDLPLFAFIGRLAEQKGIDLLVDALPYIVQQPAQAIILGSGEARYESMLRELARKHPGDIALRLGYDEALAHRIEAGADIFLMPSRFEPCGLNQLYSLRYGTVPVVRGVGGLADTVTDVSREALEDGSANGFVFWGSDGAALAEAAQRAIRVYRDAPTWRRLQLAGMKADFSWRHSARSYVALYEQALADRVPPPPT